MLFLKSMLTSVAVVSSILVGGPADAQAGHANVVIQDAWVRSTVPGQKGTGAFMKITAKEGAQLVGVSSPVAGVGEVHEMTLVGDIMKMRALASLDLPAGKVVELKPGGYHVMLMDLKQPLVNDSKMPLTLRFRNAKGVESKMELMLSVSALAPGASAVGSHGAAAHKH